VEVTERFFEAESGRIAEACLAMARRFERGGRLLAFGLGAAATDAHHVSVEFVHPVLVGKRALPALALTADVAALTGAAREPAACFAELIDRLGRPEDIALGIRARTGADEAVPVGLDRAAALGMLPVELTGGMGPARPRDGGFVFSVPSGDPMVVQEIQETLYHVFWELVHVFFEHRVAS
jgi:D-sedoheptulose 7-phosphate isomerase